MVGEDGRVIRFDQLKPFLTVTVLECTSDDPAAAFVALQRHLRQAAIDPGRAIGVALTGETYVDVAQDGPGPGRLLAGLDTLHAVTREKVSTPSWAVSDSPFADHVNELVVAMRRNRLVAVRTDQTEPLLRWAHLESTPYRRIPDPVLAGIFDGAGKTLWLKGVHRPRNTKADSKVLNGNRLQDALDPAEDASYALSAMKVTFTPADEGSVLNGDVTVSSKSKLSFRAMPDFATFVAATVEALDLLEKTLANENGVALFPELAVPENDLSTVTGAFDLRVVGADELRGDPTFVEGDVERAELLRASIISVSGEPTSARAVLEVGLDGAVVGWLSVTPVGRGEKCSLRVGYPQPPRVEAVTKRIKDAIGNGSLLNIYYESGHAFNGHMISRQNFTSTPYPNIRFLDFTGFDITKEKPRLAGDQAIHDAIGEDGDDSLFASVVKHYSDGWLTCDDGAGEVADFLHLDGDGTLTAIHVKGAQSTSASRSIALTAFEQVVSQAAKNIRLLQKEALTARLDPPRIGRPATWYGGARVADRSDFLDYLSLRDASHRTMVVVIQPHLLKGVHDRTRLAAEQGVASRDVRSLALLDSLLHSTRRPVMNLWDDLVVCGSADA